MLVNFEGPLLQLIKKKKRKEKNWEVPTQPEMTNGKATFIEMLFFSNFTKCVNFRPKYKLITKKQKLRRRKNPKVFSYLPLVATLPTVPTMNLS